MSRRILILVVLGVLMLGHAHYAVADDAGLPPTAQQAFDRGLAAAKQQEWGLAARYFTEAQHAAPEAPSILYDLGLAHAKAGHELAAIAWLRADLAADTHAAHADAIHAEIERLKSSARGKMTNIFQELATVIAGMEDASQQQSELNSLALYEAAAGDIQASTTHQPKYSATMDVESWAWRYYAGSLVQAGDFEGAREALTHVHTPSDQDDARRDITSGLVARHANEEARHAAEQIQDPTKRAEALKQVRIAVLSGLIEMHGLRGDVDLAPVEELLPLRTEAEQVQLLLVVAEQQTTRGQVEAARQTINRALQRARQISDVGSRIMALGTIARTQLTLGEGKAAKATAKELLALSPPSYLNPYRGELAAAQALLGNLKAAQALIDSIAYSGMAPTQKDFAYGHLAFVQAMTGDLKGAKKTAQRAARELVDFKRQRKSGQAPTHEFVGWCEANIAEALIAKGQLAEALTTLQQSPIKSTAFYVGMNNLVDAHLARGELAQAAHVTQLQAVESEDISGMTGAGAAWQHLLTALETRVAAAPDEVRPLVTDLVHTIRAYCYRSVTINDEEVLLQRLAALQRQAGDVAGARATLASLELTIWLQFAQYLSQNDAVVNLEQKLRDASTVNWAGQAVQSRMAISQLRWVASELGAYLLQLNALEHRLAQPVPAASTATNPPTP